MRPILCLALLAGPLLAQGSPGDFVRAPELRLTDTDGRPVDLADHQGAIVVLYFFRHRCPTCVRSHPALLQVLAEDEANDVHVIAIDVDGIQRPTPPAVAARLRRDLGADIPVAAATERVLHLYGRVMGRRNIPGTPTFFVLDRDGFVYSHTAGVTDPPTLMAPIEFLYGVDRYRPDRKR